MTGKRAALLVFGTYAAVDGPGLLISELWLTGPVRAIVSIVSAVAGVVACRYVSRRLTRLARRQPKVLAPGEISAKVAGEPRYQQRYRDPTLGVWNLDGVDWADRKPRRWHRHWAQTVVVDRGDEIWRCGCGAFGAPRMPWMG
jgi:hypothetical protein